MDLNTALITGAGTVLCGVLVAIIFIFGFKEKTFEEALDEQRRGELLELIRGDKGRPKKQKKAGKKAKEKPLANEGKSSSEPARHAEPPVSEATEKPTHIEFKFPEAEVVSERPPAPLPQVLQLGMGFSPSVLQLVEEASLLVVCLAVSSRIVLLVLFVYPLALYFITFPLINNQADVIIMDSVENEKKKMYELYFLIR